MSSNHHSEWCPGQLLAEDRPLDDLSARQTVTVKVRHTGDRPVQVGSHFHFFETNKCLDFTREQAYGMRLAIPAGTAVRFEPGMETEVTLIAYGGERVCYGFNNLVDGPLDETGQKEAALTAARNRGFKGA